MGYDPEGESWNSFWQSVGNWFVDVGKTIHETVTHSIVDFISKSNPYKIIMAEVDVNMLTEMNEKETKNTLPKDWPEMNPNAPGWGANGEYTTWQKTMMVIAAAGYVACIIGLFMMNAPLLAIGGVIGIIFTALGGFIK